MEARFNIVTLGVADLARSRAFYEKGLGWEVSAVSTENIVFFKLTNIILALYPKHLLAEDAAVSEKGNGFSGITIAQNVRTKEEVAKALNLAERAGGKITKPAQDVFWGGHSGYFADPDGYLWEVAWNPHFKMDANGTVTLP